MANLAVDGLNNILSMDENQFQKMKQAGIWPANTAAELEAMRFQKKNETELTASPIGQQQAQQASDVVTQQALQGTGVNPTLPPVVGSGQVEVPMAAPVPTVPATVQAPAQTEAQKEQQAEAGAIEVEPAIKEAADVMQAGAREGAQRAVQTQRAADDARAAAEHEAKDAAMEEKVAADLNADPHWGARIGQAIAIMMGGLGQGLTGAKENSAVEAIQRQIDRQAKERQWSEEQKQKAHELILKAANLEMEKKKAVEESALRRAQIDKTQAETIKLGNESADARALQTLASKRRLTDDEIRALPLNPQGSDMRARAVKLPIEDPTGQNNTLVRSPELAKKLNDEYIPNAKNSLSALKSLDDMAEYFGNNPLKKSLSRDEIAIAEQSVQQLVGAIRLDYFGPGAFTDTEQKLAKSLIGNPSALLSLDSANRARIRNLSDKIKYITRQRLVQAGADMPPSMNDRKLQIFMKRNPKLTSGQAISILQEAGKWDREEF